MPCNLHISPRVLIVEVGRGWESGFKQNFYEGFESFNSMAPCGISKLWPLSCHAFLPLGCAVIRPAVWEIVIQLWQMCTVMGSIPRRACLFGDCFFFSGFLGFSANFLDKEGGSNLTNSTQNYILHRGFWCMGSGDMDGCISRPCSNYCQHSTHQFMVIIHEHSKTWAILATCILTPWVLIWRLSPIGQIRLKSHWLTWGLIEYRVPQRPVHCVEVLATTCWCY